MIYKVSTKNDVISPAKTERKLWITFMNAHTLVTSRLCWNCAAWRCSITAGEPGIAAYTQVGFVGAGTAVSHLVDIQIYNCFFAQA
jgi:hypothetical protein